MFALILSVIGLLGYVGLVVVTVIRKQYVYAFAFLISIFNLNKRIFQELNNVYYHYK